MQQFPPPPPSWSPPPLPPPPPPVASAAWQPASGPPPRPTRKKSGWKIPAAIAIAVGAIGIGVFAVVRATSSVRTSAVTTTPVNSTSSATSNTTQIAPVSTIATTLPTTAPVAAAVSTAPKTPTSIAGIANTAMTRLQFDGIKSVIKQIAQVDISPYEDCIRQAPYTVQMTDATLLVCLDDAGLRLQYIKAALDRSGLVAGSTPAFIDCYEAAIVTDEFSVRLSNPVGVGEEADAWAIDQFTSAGLACSKPNG